MSNYPRLDDNGLLYYTQQIKSKIDDAIPDDMTGASASANGAHGLVPQPNQGQQAQFLRGDGAWATPPGIDTDATQTTHGLMSASDKVKLDGIEAGAEENDIASISVNGTPVTPDSNKNVNIVTPTAPVQSVSKNGTVITPDASGNVNVIVPTATSDLTNDSDFQTGTEVEAAINAKISTVLKPSGSILFANLPALSASVCNNIYDISDAFTTTSDFVEGSGKSYPAHTNVAIINVGTSANPTYKYDTYGSLIDTSGFVLTSEMTTISNSEIDDIIDTAFDS